MATLQPRWYWRTAIFTVVAVLLMAQPIRCSVAFAQDRDDVCTDCGCDAYRRQHPNECRSASGLTKQLAQKIESRQAAERLPADPDATVPSVTVPSVTGKSIEYAVGLLERHRLHGVIRGEQPSREKRGTVLKSDPAAGASVRPGTSIPLWIASGHNQVPRLVGQSRGRAAAALEHAGFALGDVEMQPDEGLSGLVIRQKPAARTLVELGTPVAVVLSSPWPKVPDIVGKQEQTAAAEVRAAGLFPQRQGTRASLEDAGVVLHTRPEANRRVPPDTAVGYWIASGENIIPDLRGRSADATRELLQSARFTLGAVRGQVDLGDPSLVLSQSPLPGSAARHGTPVQVVLSKNLLVPKLVGSPESEARGQLGQLALVARKAGERNSLEQQYTVLETSPAAGSKVRENTTVAYWIASGKNTVPDLLRKTDGQARRLLQADGFNMGNISVKADPGPQSLVLEQTPRAGSTAPLGSAVAVTISSEFPFVPDVIGHSRQAALQGIAQAGLRAEFVAAEAAPEPLGTVVRTEPVANTRIDPEAPVRYWTASDDSIVPSLLGKSLEQAQQSINAARLVLGEVSYRYDPEQPEQVRQQTPTGKTVVRKQSKIDVVLSSAQPIVPDLRGKSLDEAKRKLAEAGLTQGTIDKEFRLEGGGLVFKQSHPPGARVNANTVIAISIAKPFVALAVMSVVVLLGGAGGWWTQLRPWPMSPDVKSSAFVESPSAPHWHTDGLLQAPDVRLSAFLEADEPSQLTLPVVKKEAGHD